MRAKKTRPSRPKRTAKRARRAQASIPTLQMTVNARQTDWTCPSCFARGSVEHPADSATDGILELVRVHHSIKQPSCSVS
jgi:hypothetical protein